MEIHYDVVAEFDDGRVKEFLDSGIQGKAKALWVLAEQRREHPSAYLLKCVVTRCLEKL